MKLLKALLDGITGPRRWTELPEGCGTVFRSGWFHSGRGGGV